MSRAPHSPFRKAASFVIGLGCLFTAGSVLSSVVKSAPHRLSHDERFAPHNPSVVLISLPEGATGHSYKPQMAVSVCGTTLQIKNVSTNVWRDGHLQVGNGSSGQVCWQSVVVAPSETVTIPLGNVYEAGSRASGSHHPLSIIWVCRTDRTSDRWHGLLIM